MALAAVIGCARPAPAPPPPAPPPLSEEPLAPSTTIEFQVGPIEQTRSADGRELFVTGTVRNTGSRASRELKVRVAGLAADGAEVARADALPTPQAVPPGASATYVVRLPDDPAIRTIHVEAAGR